MTLLPFDLKGSITFCLIRTLIMTQFLSIPSCGGFHTTNTQIFSKKKYNITLPCQKTHRINLISTVLAKDTGLQLPLSPHSQLTAESLINTPSQGESPITARYLPGSLARIRAGLPSTYLHVSFSFFFPLSESKTKQKLKRFSVRSGIWATDGPVRY